MDKKESRENLINGLLPIFSKEESIKWIKFIDNFTDYEKELINSERKRAIKIFGEVMDEKGSTMASSYLSAPFREAILDSKE